MKKKSMAEGMATRPNRAVGGISEVRNTNVQMDGVARTPYTAETRTETRTEFIATVNRRKGVGGAEVRLELNPGLLSLPWLRQKAVGYEFHRIKSIKARYIPSCSANTNGNICMAFDYDPNDSAPQSRKDLSAYGGAAQAAVRVPFEITYNPKMAGGGSDWRAVRTNYMASYSRGSQPNLLLADFGTLYLWSDGADDADDLLEAGSLYLVYEWEMKSPQLVGAVAGANWFKWSGGAADGVTPTNVWGTQVASIENFVSGWPSLAQGTVGTAIIRASANKYAFVFLTKFEGLVTVELIGSGMDDEQIITLTPLRTTQIDGGIVGNNAITMYPATYNDIAAGNGSSGGATLLVWNFRALAQAEDIIEFDFSTLVATTVVTSGILLTAGPFQYPTVATL